MFRPALVLATLSVFAGSAHAEETLEVPDEPSPEETAGASEAHTDLMAGAGILTTGLGLAFGHRFGIGLRAELGAGALGDLSGMSAGFGGSFVVMRSGKHRIEVPVMGEGLRYDCSNCGTDGASLSGGMLGLATGLDWLYGQDGSDPGFILSFRLGAGGATFHDTYDDVERTGAVPIAQLGAGWAF